MTATAAVTATAARAGAASSLSRRDRRLLLACLAMVALAALVVAFLAPQQDETDTTPSTFSSGTHGAEAVFLALQRSGYRIERWERPLDDLVPQADAHTVVIFAEPNFTRAMGAKNTVQQILGRGGRVLVTGLTGALLLAENQVQQTPTLTDDLQRGCAAQPEGFGSLANSGVVNFRAQNEWNTPRPDQRVQYTCGGNAVVVSYPSGKGQVVWWSDSQPLENGSIAKDGDLALLLASLGSPEDRTANRIVWDESLHNDEAGIWSYANGTPIHLLWLQLALVALLLILSFSRRSGPLLPDPVIARDTPLEFVLSLGALYDKAGATNTAVSIAYDRFRWMLGRRARPGSAAQTEEMLSIASARLGHTNPELGATIAACEELTYETRQIEPKRALTLVHSLNKFEQQIRQEPHASDVPKWRRPE